MDRKDRDIQDPRADKNERENTPDKTAKNDPEKTPEKDPENRDKSDPEKGDEKSAVDRLIENLSRDQKNRGPRER